MRASRLRAGGAICVEFEVIDLKETSKLDPGMLVNRTRFVDQRGSGP